MKPTLLAMALLIAAAVPAVAQRGGDEDRVCFYRDVQFQGTAWCYRPGDELADLRDRRNEISSIRVFGRARVIVYDEREFLGVSDEFDRDVSDLTLRNMEGRRTWNDRIESFQVQFTGRERDQYGRRDNRDRGVLRDRVCVYAAPNYQGRSQCWDAGEEEANLARVNGWNDQISSIRVFGRTAVEIYRDASFRGARMRITSDVADLGSINWSDQISSFRVR